jgi:signal transduction histidine kinase
VQQENRDDMAGLLRISSSTIASWRQLPWRYRSVAVSLPALAAIVPLAALSSREGDWQPVTLVLALTALMVLADVVVVGARKVRQSSGLTVQVMVMALLGPAPAIAIGVFSTVVESLVNHVRAPVALTNAAVFAWLGLVGGVLFDLLGQALHLDPEDSGYAVLVVPVFSVLAALNIALIAATTFHVSGTDRLHLIRESVLPMASWEMVSCVMAAAAVLAWAHLGHAAVAVLLILLVVTTPLLRALEAAIKRGDDVLELRQISDERAAEVAQLASDRSRLLSEVLEAEERERARLAESLHDGPLQRLAALRQDVREGEAATSERLAAGLDAAIAEVRAIVSAFHPVSVRECGFEASLRAAVAPFAVCRPIELVLRSTVPDRVLAGTLLLRIAQELVVNAVKHGQPTRVEVSVSAARGTIRLEVCDDGVGIDSAESDRAVQAGHVGLAVVRRRVEDANGRFEIATRGDGGTRSRVSLPDVGSGSLGDEADAGSAAGTLSG